MSKSDDWSDAGFQYPKSQRHEPGEMDGNYRSIQTGKGQLIYDGENNDAWVMSSHYIQITSEAKRDYLEYNGKVIDDAY